MIDEGQTNAGEQRPRDAVRFVRALARRYLADPEAAADLEQQVWLTALSSPGEREPSRRLLGALAKRIAIDQYRAKLLRRTVELPESLGNAGLQEDPLVIEARERVSAAVAALDEPYRQTIRLRFLDELSPREVAGRLGVPLETVNTRVKRGLALLRARLERREARDRSLRGLWLTPFRIPRVALAAATVAAALSLAIVWSARATRGQPLVLPERIATGDAPPSFLESPAPDAVREAFARDPLHDGVRAGRRVRGRVELKGGGPAASAEVLAHSGADARSTSAAAPIARVPCTPDGTFSLVGLPERFVLSAQGPGLVSDEWLVVEPGASELIDVRFFLAGATTTPGRVEGARTGAILAVPGIGVRSPRPAGATGAHYQGRSAYADLDGEGGFVLPALIAGKYTLLADVPGRAHGWRSIELPSAELVLDLHAGGRLYVGVTDAAGQPAVDCELLCLQPRPPGAPLVGKRWLGLESTRRTDAQGSASFDGLRAEADALLVARDGERILAAAWLAPPIDRQPVRLQLRPERMLVGMVLRADGRPLAGGTIVVEPIELPADFGERGFPLGRAALRYGRARTDPEGRFVIKRLACSPQVLEAFDPQSSSQVRILLDGSERDVTVRFPASERTRALTVFDRATGSAIPSFELVTLTAQNRVRRVRPEAPHGRLSLSWCEDDPVVAAVVWSDGFALRTLSHSELALNDPAVPLERATRIELQLLDALGQGAGGCGVRVLDRDGVPQLLDCSNGQARDALVAGADGRVTLLGAPATELFVEVWRPGLSDPERFEIPAAQGDTPLELRTSGPERGPGSMVLSLVHGNAERAPWHGPLELRVRDAQGRVAVHLRGVLEPTGFRNQAAPPIRVVGQGRNSIFEAPGVVRWIDAPDVLERLPWLPGGTLELAPAGEPNIVRPLDSGHLVVALPPP